MSVKQIDLNETDKAPTHHTYQQGSEINVSKTANKQKQLVSQKHDYISAYS